ncbi:MAG: uracil-DNA glycosylase family protein, partial [Mesorhizobium sp.]
MSQGLERLTARARACRICVDQPLGRPLPHEPRPVLRPSSSARILLAS